METNETCETCDAGVIETICIFCSGSGEGPNEHIKCKNCKGSGIQLIFCKCKQGRKAKNANIL